MREKRQECACERGLVAGGWECREASAAWSRSTVIGAGTESEGPGSQHLLAPARLPRWANLVSKDSFTPGSLHDSAKPLTAGRSVPLGNGGTWQESTLCPFQTLGWLQPGRPGPRLSGARSHTASKQVNWGLPQACFRGLAQSQPTASRIFSAPNDLILKE